MAKFAIISPFWRGIVTVGGIDAEALGWRHICEGGTYEVVEMARMVRAPPLKGRGRVRIGGRPLASGSTILRIFLAFRCVRLLCAHRSILIIVPPCE